MAVIAEVFKGCYNFMTHDWNDIKAISLQNYIIYLFRMLVNAGVPEPFFLSCPLVTCPLQNFWWGVLIQSVCVCVAQSCLTLRDSVDCSPPGSSVHGILQARILEWVAMPFSRGSSQSRDWTCVSYVSCIGQWFLYHSGGKNWPGRMVGPMVPWLLLGLMHGKE